MKPKLLLTASIALLLSLLIAVPVKRIRYSSDATPNNEKASNNKFWQIEAIPIEGAVGPESFAFDPLGGGPYTSISDGRIIKWDHNQRRWINFAITSPQRSAAVQHTASILKGGQPTYPIRPRAKDVLVQGCPCPQ